MKKIAYIIISFLFIFAFQFSAWAQVRVSALQAGDLIKASNPSVYYFGFDGKRYVFPNEKTYFSWYSNFNTVKKISDAELSSIQIGGNVTYKPGSKLVKVTTDPKVYWVDIGGSLRHVSAEQIAVALFGSDWAKKVDDIPDAFFVNYKTGAPLSAPSLPVLPVNLTIDIDKGLVAAPQNPPKPSTFNVDIKDFAFTPAMLKIKRGDTVVWTNMDSAPHEVASNPHPIHTDHPELRGPTQLTGETYTFTFINTGTYNYHCHLHPGMLGTIIVESSSTVSAAVIDSKQIIQMPEGALLKLTPLDRYHHVRDTQAAIFSVEEYINEYRRLIGHLPFWIEPNIRTAAVSHAVYQSNVQDKTLNNHFEDASHPLFYGVDPTARCQKAGYAKGCGEVIAWDYPDFYSTVDNWMSSPFHRLPLITEPRRDIGCGSSRSWDVCDFGPEAKELRRDVVYPGHGQVIPAAFRVREEPRPYPAFHLKTIGPTIMYYPAKPIASIEYGFFNLATKQSYELLLPDPATEPFFQGAFLFNPKQVLPADTEFLVVVRGNYADGATFEKYWSFKTQIDHNTDFPDIVTKIRYNSTAHWMLTLPASPGDLIKASSPAVYFYGKDRKRYVFANEKTFFTWHDNFEGVKVISDAELAALPVGRNVTYKPGSRLVKVTTDPRVYWVGMGGVLHHICSESIAVNLFGPEWAKKIDDLPDTFFTNYRISNALIELKLPSLVSNLTIDTDVVISPAPENQSPIVCPAS